LANGADPVGDAPEIRRLFDDARFLNASITPLIRAGQFDAFTRRPESAAVLLREAVRREPENPEAWATLAAALRQSDPATARQAQRRYEELVGG
jgi:Flp pilus assembly protein TadD